MTKTILAAVAFALATPAFAADAPAERTFTRDGATYTYTKRIDGDATIIEGRNVSTGEPFKLTVRDNWVEGKYDNKPVTFLAPNKSTSVALTAQ